MHGKRNRAPGPTIDSVTDEGRSTDETRILPQAGAYNRHVFKGLDCVAQMTAWISSIRRPNACETPPPMMIRSGLKRWITLVNPAPR